MRKHELKDGIEVLDGSGKVVGTSQVAAKCVSDLSYTNSDDTVEPLLLAPKKALIGLQGPKKIPHCTFKLKYCTRLSIGFKFKFCHYIGCTRYCHN